MRDFIYNVFVVSFQQWWRLLKNNFSFARRLVFFSLILILIDVFLIFIHFWSYDYSLGMKIAIVCIILLVTFIAFMFWFCGLLRTYASSAHIDNNIDSLPREIWGHKVIVQYTPPNWINPSEMWFLYYLTSDKELTKALLYKRESEWLIEISDDINEHWKYTAKKLKELNLMKVPEYEKNYWLITFWKASRDKVFDLDYLVASSRSIQIKIEEYCVEKWWVIKTNFGIEQYQYVIVSLICLVGMLFFVSITLALVCFALLIVYFIYTPFLQLDYKRTDEWNKLYAHIMWYKHYLECCEEKQLLEWLKEDSHHAKLLPTMIALKMDWKFLEKAYFQDISN